MKAVQYIYWDKFEDGIENYLHNLIYVKAAVFSVSQSVSQSSYSFVCLSVLNDFRHGLAYVYVAASLDSVYYFKGIYLFL